MKYSLSTFATNFLQFGSLEEFQEEFKDINQEEQISRLHKMLAPHLLRSINLTLLYYTLYVVICFCLLSAVKCVPKSASNIYTIVNSFSLYKDLNWYGSLFA